MIYEPAEDSFLLLKQVEKYSKDKKVLDMGTGFGIQAVTAIRCGAREILAADINPEAVEHVKLHITGKKFKVIKSDLFENIKEKFDLIIFNPPYLPEEPLEPEDSKLSTTGGKKGNEILTRFLKQAKGHLNENGKILIVFSSLTPNVDKILEELNYKFKKLDEQKIDFETLYVYLIE
jgi:release factor glutamine methyltransferase